MDKNRKKFSIIKSPNKKKVKTIKPYSNFKPRTKLLSLTIDEMYLYKKYSSSLINSENPLDIYKKYSIKLSIENPIYYYSSFNINQPDMFNKSKSNKIKDYSNILFKNIKDFSLSVPKKHSTVKNDKSKVQEHFHKNSKSINIPNRNRNGHKTLTNIVDEYDRHKIRMGIINNINNLKLGIANKKFHKQLTRKISFSNNIKKENHKISINSNNDKLTQYIQNCSVRRSITSSNVLMMNIKNNSTSNMFIELITKAKKDKLSSFFKEIFISKEEIEHKKRQMYFNYLYKLSDNIKNKSDDLLLSKQASESKEKDKKIQNQNSLPGILSFLDLRSLTFNIDNNNTLDKPTAKLFFSNNITNETANFEVNKRKDIKEIISVLEEEGSIIDSPLIKHITNMKDFKLEIKIQPMDKKEESQYEIDSIITPNSDLRLQTLSQKSVITDNEQFEI